MQGEKFNMYLEPRFKYMYEMVENINEFEVLDYKPQRTIIEFVNDFWLKQFDREMLLGAEINVIENKCKEIFKHSYPNRVNEKSTIRNFTGDTIFHLAFRLSKQGARRDSV